MYFRMQFTNFKFVSEYLNVVLGWIPDFQIHERHGNLGFSNVGQEPALPNFSQFTKERETWGYLIFVSANQMNKSE